MYMICWKEEYNVYFVQSKWEIVSGEDTMKIRCAELFDNLDITPEDMHVFNMNDEIN